MRSIKFDKRYKRYKRNKRYCLQPIAFSLFLLFALCLCCCAVLRAVLTKRYNATNSINAINAINATNALRFILFDLGVMSALCGYPTLIRCVTDDRNTSPLGFFYNSFFGKNQTFTGLYCKYTAAIFFNYIQCL